MWKFIFLAIALYALYRFFANDFFKRQKEAFQAREAEKEERIATGDMVKDPECGAFVAVDDSISVRDGERVFYFCSYECRDKFLKRLEDGSVNLPPKDEQGQ